MTTASQISAAANRKPRTRPVPSSRDQQVYLDYQSSGMLQTDLAKKYELTQCRISQIVRRVESWLYATDDVEADDTGRVPGFERSSNPVEARQRLLNRLESERLNSVCRHAMQHFQQQQKTVTHKKGSRGGKDIDETTERLLPANLQCLKVVLQANSQLNRLQKQSAESEDGVPTDQQEREEVEAWLTERRKDAQREGKVPWDFGPNILVRDLVGSLLGEPNTGVGLVTLARESGKKIVDRKSYDDNPPNLPEGADGWYYAMYDYHGGLVAWLSADQIRTSVHPDYKPVRTGAAATQDGTPPADKPPEDKPHTTTTSSTTSPPAPDSAQGPASPALASSPPQTNSGPLTLNDPAVSGVIDGTHNCGVV